MTENDAGTPDKAHAPGGEPEALDDLSVDDEAAQHVTGGDAAQTDSQFRGRYQLKLDEAKGLLK